MEKINKAPYLQDLNAENQEIVLFRTDDEQVAVDVIFAEETVWLTQEQICHLYGKAKSTISEHISNIFSEEELVKEQVVRNFRTTASDGKNKNVLFMLWQRKRLVRNIASISNAHLAPLNSPSSIPYYL